MSEIMIALILLVPIIVVIIALNSTSKKSKKKADIRILAFITEILNKTGLTSHFHQRLVYQTVIIDEKKKKLVVIDHKGADLTYEIVELANIKKAEVTHLKQSVVTNPKNKRPETITTHVGVTIASEKEEDTFLCFYDYTEHNIYLLTDFDLAAKQLKERIDYTSKAIIHVLK